MRTFPLPNIAVMLAAVRSRLRSAFPAPLSAATQWRRSLCSLSSASGSSSKRGLLQLEEVQQILADVRADDVRVIPVRGVCQFADFMVIATGRSAWHVRNIAQALIYKVKEKQKGAEQMLLPSIEGYEGGKWVIVDSGGVVVHALDEKARAYYNLESLWTTERASKEPVEDIELIT